MKTMIIERGLSEICFYEKTKPGDIYSYVKALREIGADYIELDYNTLWRLPKPLDTDNYIYRVSKRSDIVIVNNLPFAYAVIPLSLSFLIPKINVPVVLEVNIGKSEPLPLISVVAENVDLTKVSLLRLIGDFGQLPDDINEFVVKFRSRYAVPIDFCPLNTSLTALSTAISAYAAQADSITMSFGDHDNYVSLEEFVITLATMYKIIINSNFIVGICKAVIISVLFGTVKSDNIKLLMKQYGFSSKVISLLDSAMDAKPQTIGGRKKSRKRSVFDRLLSEFNLDKKTNEQIVEILKECSVDLYNRPAESDKPLSQ